MLNIIFSPVKAELAKPDVFEQAIGHQVTSINSIKNLWAMELDPQKATEEYKDRALAPYRQIFDESIVAVMEEQLNAPCTEEMASFDKMTMALQWKN